MYLFLRSRQATFVGVLGMPISTLAAFLGLLLAGRTINVISLAGIAFAIGMTVDNTIVVLENIERLRRSGMERLQSTVTGVREVWPAVLASTLTTVLVFAPSCSSRKRQASCSPTSRSPSRPRSWPRWPLRSCSFRPPLHGGGFSGRAAERRTAASIRAFSRRSITWSRRRRCGARWHWDPAVLLALIVLLMPPAEYLPEGEEPKVFASMIAPSGYNLAEMQRIAATLNAEFAPLLEDEPDRFTRGETPFPALASLNLSVNSRSLRVIAEPKRPADIDALMAAFNARFREVPGCARSPPAVRSSRATTAARAA